MAKTEPLSFFVKLDGPSGPMWQDVFDPEVCVLAAAKNQSMKNGGHCKLLVGWQRIQNREFWCSRISPGILNILDLNEKYSRRYFVTYPTCIQCALFSQSFKNRF